MIPIHKHIERALLGYTPGDLIFSCDFRGEGSEGLLLLQSISLPE